MDERQTYRARLDTLLDQLAEITAERDALRMRAELAEERAAYAELELMKMQEGPDD